MISKISVIYGMNQCTTFQAIQSPTLPNGRGDVKSKVIAIPVNSARSVVFLGFPSVQIYRFSSLLFIGAVRCPR